MSFGFFLREYLKATKIDSGDLASKLGIAKMAMTDFEDDKRLPSVGVLERMMKILCPDVTIPGILYAYIRTIHSAKSRQDYNDLVICTRRTPEYFKRDGG